MRGARGGAARRTLAGGVPRRRRRAAPRPASRPAQDIRPCYGKYTCAVHTLSVGHNQPSTTHGPTDRGVASFDSPRTFLIPYKLVNRVQLLEWQSTDIVYTLRLSYYTS